ncbi:flavin reductase [Hylemonella sp. W303a]|uniref:flavin reductase n=1 Tax=Hylemonella sp. W303a TaxID=3389873 RepID=UPI00396B3446
MSTPVTSQEFRGALALLTGAVTLITTDGPAGRAGFTASAVCSVSDDPPTVLVCMRSAAPSNPLFRRNAVLCVNVLTPAQQPLAAAFADPQLGQAQRFSHGSWDALASGAPALHDALINLDCQVVDTHVIGTHDVCICRVQGVRVRPEDEALAYFNRAYHHLNAASRLG